MRRLLLTIAMTVLSWGVAQAQLPGKQVVGGQVHAALGQANPGGAWCFVGRGLSIFEGSANGSEAVISLPEVFYFDGTTYYLLNGLTHLNFTSPTGGIMKFRFTEYSPAVTTPAFTNYTEAVGESPNLTVVNFSINFTNGTNSSNCTLPVTIKYEMD
jgi:hypothetical protein